MQYVSIVRQFLSFLEREYMSELDMHINIQNLGSDFNSHYLRPFGYIVD